MNPDPPIPSQEDVLNAFAVEPEPLRETLEYYLRKYPEYASELIDLSAELSRPLAPSEEPLSEAEKALVDASWEQHRVIAASSRADPFDLLSLNQLRHVAKSLNIPRQVLTAFRERIVLVPSVPLPFLRRLAASLSITHDDLVAFLEKQPSSVAAMSHKADEKPVAREVVEFEQLLTEAGVSEEQRAQLLAEDE